MGDIKSIKIQFIQSQIYLFKDHPVFTCFQSRSQLSEELFMVSTCALQNAACGVPPAGVAGCAVAVKFAPGVTMFRVWKQVMKELGQKFGGKKRLQKWTVWKIRRKP